MVVFSSSVQTGDMQAHIDAQLRIEVRERLIEHKHPGITHDSAANGHTLPLAAGELLRFTIQQVQSCSVLATISTGDGSPFSALY